MTTAYPLAWPEGWPRSRSRKRARFNKGERQYYGDNNSSSWMRKRDLSISEATQRVLSELTTFGVPHGEAIISSNLQLRLDGLPRSGQAAPSDPGVAVYWRRPGESMKVMAIDLYDRVADNLAAVAATLHAMRAIERHGGAQILDRAFTGFAALPPPKSPWKVLGLDTPNDAVTREQVNEAYRAKARALHPDVGGSEAAMAELNAARDAALKVFEGVGL